MKIGSSHAFFCTSYLPLTLLNPLDPDTSTAQKIKNERAEMEIQVLISNEHTALFENGE